MTCPPVASRWTCKETHSVTAKKDAPASKLATNIRAWPTTDHKLFNITLFTIYYILRLTNKKRPLFRFGIAWVSFLILSSNVLKVCRLTSRRHPWERDPSPPACSLMTCISITCESLCRKASAASRLNSTGSPLNNVIQGVVILNHKLFMVV